MYIIEILSIPIKLYVCKSLLMLDKVVIYQLNAIVIISLKHLIVCNCTIRYYEFDLILIIMIIRKQFVKFLNSFWNVLKFKGVFEEGLVENQRRVTKIEETKYYYIQCKRRNWATVSRRANGSMTFDLRHPPNRLKSVVQTTNNIKISHRYLFVRYFLFFFTWKFIKYLYDNTNRTTKKNIWKFCIAVLVVARRQIDTAAISVSVDICIRSFQCALVLFMVDLGYRLNYFTRYFNLQIFFFIAKKTFFFKRFIYLKAILWN